MAMSFRSKYAYRVFFLLGCTEFIVHCTMCVAFFSFIGEISDDRKYSDEKALSASSLAPRFNIAKCLYICANATNFFSRSLVARIFFPKSSKNMFICDILHVFMRYIYFNTDERNEIERKMRANERIVLVQATTIALLQENPIGIGNANKNANNPAICWIICVRLVCMHRLEKCSLFNCKLKW